jgi:hypothetical protein
MRFRHIQIASSIALFISVISPWASAQEIPNTPEGFDKQ